MLFRSDMRALGLATGSVTQVSMNLVNPGRTGPADAFDAVSTLATTEHVRVLRAELVGLLPRAVLRALPQERWGELDVSEERTIEARLAERGLSR